jgi:hypothetical protein
MKQLTIFLFMVAACSSGVGVALAYLAKLLIETQFFNIQVPEMASASVEKPTLAMVAAAGAGTTSTSAATTPQTPVAAKAAAGASPISSQKS